MKSTDAILCSAVKERTVDEVLADLSLENEEREKDRQLKAELEAQEAAQALPSVPTLTDEEERQADAAIRGGDKSTFARAECGPRDYSTLQRRAWLNDEVINFYIALLQARNDASNGKVFFHNSFFYSKLATQGYEKGRLAKWTKKVDLFTFDRIVFPINHNNTHWTSGCINFKDKRIEYFDSLASKGLPSVYTNLRAYIDAEHRAKKGRAYDFTGWTDFYDPSMPQQSNGSDCGVFACQTMEHRARGVDAYEFDQGDIDSLRKVMAYEIKTHKLKPRG